MRWQFWKRGESRQKELDLVRAFQEAQSNRPDPPPLTETERFVGLQRKWMQSYNTTPPDDMDLLAQVIPCGLSHTEEEQYLRGAAMDAARAYMKALNQSWTKPEADLKFREEGIVNALSVFTPEEQEGLKTVYKFLPEGEENNGNSEKNINYSCQIG